MKYLSMLRLNCILCGVLCCLNYACAEDETLSSPFFRAAVSAAPTVTPTVHLEQNLFVTHKQTRPIRDLIVHKDLSGRAIPPDALPLKVRAKLQRLSTIIVPSIEIRGGGIAALAAIASLSQEQTPKISLGETIPVPETTASPLWLQELDLGNVALDTSDLKRVPYLELMDRIAQVFNLQIGVLSSGDLIFGRQGDWVEGYVPTCTIELGVRAPEALIQKAQFTLDKNRGTSLADFGGVVMGSQEESLGSGPCR